MSDNEKSTEYSNGLPSPEVVTRTIVEIVESLPRGSICFYGSAADVLKGILPAYRETGHAAHQGAVDIDVIGFSDLIDWNDLRDVAAGVIEDKRNIIIDPNYIHREDGFIHFRKLGLPSIAASFIGIQLIETKFGNVPVITPGTSLFMSMVRGYFRKKDIPRIQAELQHIKRSDDPMEHMRLVIGKRALYQRWRSRPNQGALVALRLISEYTGVFPQFKKAYRAIIPDERPLYKHLNEEPVYVL